MAYEILIETIDEACAPPEQPLLALAFTPAGNGYGAVVHLDIVKVEETYEQRTYTRLEGISVNAQEFLDALSALPHPKFRDEI